MQKLFQSQIIGYKSFFSFIIFSLLISNNIISQVNYTSNLDVANDATGEGLWDNNGFAGTGTGACGGTGLSMKDNCWGTTTSQIVEMWNSSSLGTATGGDIAVSFDYVIYDYNSTTAASASDFKEIKVYVKSTTPTTSSLGTLVHTVSSHSSTTSCTNVSLNITGHTGDTYLAITYEHSNDSSPDNDILFDNISAIETTCIQPTASFTLVPNCPTDFSIEVDVTLNDATGVDISDDDASTSYSFTNAGAGISTMGPYTLGTDVIVTIDGTAYGCASMVSSAAMTEECSCTTVPMATVTSSNLDCTTNMYDIMVTVDSDGDGDANMSDILIDGSVVQANAMVGNAYTFTVALGSHTVTIEAEGAGFVSCVSADYIENMSCNGGDICSDAVDILGTTSTCDLTTAVNEGDASLTPCFESVGNGTTLGKGDCNGEGCFENSSYYYTEYKDIWYVIDLPDGVDQFSVNFTGLTCNVAVFPYTSTCGSLSLMDITGGVGTGLADSDNDGTIEEEANQNPFIGTDGVIHFKGADVATASTAPIYLRVFAHDNNASGTACSSADIVNCSFTIGVTSPQPNDVCGDGLQINSFDEDATNDPDSYLPVTQSGDISAANTDADTHDDVDGTTCNGITFDTGEEDLWYALRTPDNGNNYFLDVDIDFTGTADEIYVLLHNYCSNGDSNPIGCESISADGTVSFDASNMTNFDMALTPDNDYNIRIVLPTGSNATTFDISATLIAENNTCEVMQTPFPGFDIPPSGSGFAEFNMNFASDSGSDPVIAGSDLWYHFDPETSTDAFGQTTASTTAEIQIGGLDAGEEVTLLLYKGQGVSTNNCNDLAGDYLESLVVTADGTVELSCLDELHTSVSGGYLVRIVQTAGSTIIDEGTIIADPQPAGPFNNDCSNIWNGSGPTNLGWTDPSPGESDGVNDGGLENNFNPYVIEPGDVNYLSGDFENATDCHPDIASAVCNGVDQQAIAPNEDRDLWYIITVPDLTGPCDLTMSETITSVTFTYNSGSASEDAILYIYDGCSDANLIDCSGSLDGASPGTDWTVSGLTQGDSYLVRVKPHDISSNGVMNEFDFDLSWNTADPSPCNDDPASAEGLSVGCFNYSGLETWSAQGATQTSPVDGAGENDVWFSFTAPTGNGGTYTSGTPESWVSVFFEEVSGHTLYMDLYNTPSTDAAGKTWDTSSSDQAWGVFGNLNEGQTYYIRLYHKELPTVNVQYKIAINDGPGVEPGWGCGENSLTNITDCASGCIDLREAFFKIDLPDNTPGNKYWAIEVTGIDQDLDFELRSKYLNGSTTYVTGTSGTDGAVEGSAADFDHPCSSVALEGAVSISSTTTGLTGCDGNDSLGDIDPASTSQGSDGDTNVGSGVSRVYFNMNGAVTGQKDYYYLRVFIDPNDPRYNEWAEVKICDISFKGPYSTQALAEAGGTPDENCDPVTCEITNVVVSDDNTCNGDDATFTVTFDVSEGGGSYEVYDTDTDATLATTTAAADATDVTISVIVSGPVTGSTINIDVRDAATNACNGGIPQAAILATCPNTTVAVDDFNNTPEGVTVTGNVLDNDYDPQGDTQDVSTTITTNPTKGTVTIDAAGKYTYIPTAGQTGEDSFEYTVCDDQTPEACDVATVYIEIIENPVNGNNPPIADTDYALTEVDTPVSGSLISNDNDPDGDNLVINTTPVSDPSNGTLTINPDGTYEYTPNSMFVGMDMFSYEVCDDGVPSMCDVTTVTIDIIPDNGNITSAADDAGIGLINETITGSLTGNDTDPEGDTQTINTTPVTDPGVAGASVTINSDGTYEYVPATDFVGNDEFMYEICDNAMPTIACVTATVHITILPGKPNLTYAVDDFNHTPVDEAVTGNVISNDFDPENDNQVVSILLVSSPANGMVTIDPSGVYTYTPDADYSGPDSFEYEVCDDDMVMEACDIATVYLTVIPDPVSGNDAPIANPDYSLTEVNTPILGNMISNDNDPDGEPLTVNTTPESMPTNGTVIIYPNGTYQYTPNTDFIGSDVFSYEVCDADNVCDITTVSIDVLPNTGNITGASDDSGIGIKNTNISGDLLDNDSDPEGDAQSVNTTPVSMPMNGSVTIYPDGSYDYVPTSDFVGNDEFVYEVCDNGDPQACKSATVYLTVLDVKEDPEYTMAFNTDGTSYLNGDSKDGYYVVENIGTGESLEGISLTFTIPNTSVFTTTFDETMTSANVAGGTSVDNGKFTYTVFSNFIFATLKSGETIASGSDLKIGFTFTAIGSPLSTAGTTGQVQSFTAGDIIETNNYAQGSFRIN